MTARRRPLTHGRQHFQHGPIDLVVHADGDPAAVDAAHRAAWRRFEPLLDELVAELPALRRPVAGPLRRGRLGATPDDAADRVGAAHAACPLHGIVARRMWQACRPHAAEFITPMAAVAGAVAEELVACYRRPAIDRAWVNNGGDIALHLAPRQSVRVGLYADLSRLDARQRRDGIDLDGGFVVGADRPVRGVATSGWRGRSFSLGIADSVTVLAATASMADAAATVVANAVDADDPRILRRPACELADDTDLGRLAVTVDVPPLAAPTVAEALCRGARRAEALRRAGLVEAVVLTCQRQLRVVGGAERFAAVGAGPAARHLHRREATA